MIYTTERIHRTPGYLVLADGSSFELELISSDPGRYGSGFFVGGEVVFNTVLSGYQEVITDPSYAGQMVTFTTPEIGNYGVNTIDMESPKVWAQVVIVRNYSGIYSNYRGERSLLDLCEESNVPLVSSIDTRALTRHLRNYGALAGVIGTAEPSVLQKLITAEMTTDGRDLASEVSRREIDVHGSGPRIVAIDYGIKRSIIRYLSHKFETVVVPARTSVEEIMAYNPRGLFLSNGPGDPAAVDYAVNQIAPILGSMPIFGICLGHQLLARAVGATTVKLKFGHHGGNHPVGRGDGGAVEITSQNHNYAVTRESLAESSFSTEVTHINLNDQVVEGFSVPSMRAFAVQYHPEAAPGPHDSLYLFEEFSKLVQGK